MSEQDTLIILSIVLALVFLSLFRNKKTKREFVTFYCLLLFIVTQCNIWINTLN